MSAAVTGQATTTMPRIYPTREVISSSDAEGAEHARKPRRTHAERREEAERSMLDAAVRIVAEHGLEYLTLAECGEAAGYSRGLAAHYFGSKDALIAALVQRRLQQRQMGIEHRDLFVDEQTNAS